MGYLILGKTIRKRAANINPELPENIFRLIGHLLRLD